MSFSLANFVFLHNREYRWSIVPYIMIVNLDIRRGKPHNRPGLPLVYFPDHSVKNMAVCSSLPPFSGYTNIHFSVKDARFHIGQNV
jgi:hypothetical protein